MLLGATQSCTCMRRSYCSLFTAGPRYAVSTHAHHKAIYAHHCLYASFLISTFTLLAGRCLAHYPEIEFYPHERMMQAR